MSALSDPQNVKFELVDDATAEPDRETRPVMLARRRLAEERAGRTGELRSADAAES